MAMGFSGIAPLIHGIVRFGFMQMMKQSGAPFYIAEGLLRGLGAVVYTVSSHVNCDIGDSLLTHQ